MDKKTGGIIATVATVLFCGLPGLCLCLFGVVTAAGVMPYETELNGIVDSGTLPASVGFAMLCIALIFILIPVAVGFFTLRKKPEDAAINAEPVTAAEDTDPFLNDDPLPPPS